MTVWVVLEPIDRGTTGVAFLFHDVYSTEEAAINGKWRKPIQMGHCIVEEAEVIEPKCGEETSNAPKTRIVQEDHQQEHQHGGSRGQASEAGRGDSDEQGGEEQEGKESWGSPVNKKIVRSLDGSVYETAEVWRKVGQGERLIKAWRDVKDEVIKYKCQSCGRLSCGCDDY